MGTAVGTVGDTPPPASHPQPWSHPPPAQHPFPASQPLRLTYHSQGDIPGLLQIYRLFQHEPHSYIVEIEIMVEEQQCCDRTVLRVLSLRPHLTLETVLAMRRMTRKGMPETELWYIVKSVVAVMCYLQREGLAYGCFRPGMWGVMPDGSLLPQVLHLQPGNQHARVFDPHNYYSPQALGAFHSDPSLACLDLPKSEVYSLGLLMLELGTCPSTRPKFYRLGWREVLQAKVEHRLQTVRGRYSGRLAELLGMMVRADLRHRPDWMYLRVWLSREGV